MEEQENIANLLFVATVLVFILLVTCVFLYTTYRQYFRKWLAFNFTSAGCMDYQRDERNYSINIAEGVVEGEQRDDGGKVHKLNKQTE